MQGTTAQAAPAALSEGLRQALIYSESGFGDAHLGAALDLLLAVLYEAKPGAEITIPTDTLLGLLESMDGRVRGARAALIHLRRAVHQHFGLSISPAEQAAFAETQP